MVKLRPTSSPPPKHLLRFSACFQQLPIRDRRVLHGTTRWWNDVLMEGMET